MSYEIQEIGGAIPMRHPVCLLAMDDWTTHNQWDKCRQLQPPNGICWTMEGQFQTDEEWQAWAQHRLARIANS
ncbi:MAG: hypothetical protein FJZ86_18445 [Chloroflexi bacterium]|nr:hypothetical protein [Chloroflexota bacterium]